MKALEKIHQEIVSCNQCPRLRKYCQEIAEVKRKAYLDETYWGKPIPGFGDPKARLMIVGLAPAAHGANRTGRVFTGDRSGEWLYRALYRAGFANQPESHHAQDGLKLNNAYITCTVRCAPPGNKPSPAEQNECSHFLQEELAAMKQIQVWIALGQIAYSAIWSALKPTFSSELRKPSFGHGIQVKLDQTRTLILSYHPSQQNTFTGRLTEPMFDSVFVKAKEGLVWGNQL